MGSDRGGGAGARRRPRSRTVLVLLAVVLVLVAVIASRRSAASGPLEASGPFFAPYVDVTQRPSLRFQSSSASPSREVALGFILAASPHSCTPSWGGQYTLAGAARTLQLERRITQLRARGGEAIGSFGGQAGTELALACSTEASLASAYAQAIERYKLGTIDIDVEGTALGDAAANERRAGAIASLQRDEKLDKGKLAVWLTLPVTPKGLPPEAASLVKTMLARDVRLAGVNAMTMDFGSARSPTRDVLLESERALSSLNRQLQAIYREAGQKLSAATAWERIGVTPMIGANDVRGESFTLADARGLLGFVKRERIARISMWSLNRDEACRAGPRSAAASNVCSGVAEAPRAFSRVFDALRGVTDRVR
ncbi:MAG: chitinase [Solirubrobacteraceae bacterium]